MSNHDHEEMEKHFDELLISIDSVQPNFATEFYSVLEKYAEHYAKELQTEIDAQGFLIEDLDNAAKTLHENSRKHDAGRSLVRQVDIATLGRIIYPVEKPSKERS